MEEARKEKEFKALLDKGIITKEEYEDRHSHDKE